jgi:hypothetical protein
LAGLQGVVLQSGRGAGGGSVRCGNSASTRQRQASSIALHLAISSMVRLQPRHRPLSGSIMQTAMHGDSGRAEDMATSCAFGSALR